MLGSGWDVRDLASLPHAPKVEETGATFEENASLKALTISRIFTGLVLADDSGLEVDALNGAPGVHSARFAGIDADDAENRFLLIDNLKKLDGDEFPACFRCVIVLASQGELLGSFGGRYQRKGDPGRTWAKRIWIRFDVYSAGLHGNVRGTSIRD